jgi:molybdate transport system permease protein
MDWQAIRLSLVLACFTSGLLLVVGVPVAYFLAFSKRRFRFLVEALVALPLVLPPTVLGYYVLLAISPRSPIGRGFEALTGRGLAFSFEGLVLGSVLYSLPFAVQPVATAFGSVNRSLIEASWCLGVSKLETAFRLVLPLSRAGILTGLVLSFAHTIGEFGLVLMIGGNLPGVTRTISIAIYDEVQALDYARAGTTSLLLVGMSFLVLSITYALRGRVFAVWPLSS